jgi:formamidopyrimidine-DNA glycosylase
MPELPEVEVLVRRLDPLLKNRTVREVRVGRAKVLAPTSARRLAAKLAGARFLGVSRRGKYLVFRLKSKARQPLTVVGHLGMTGRMYLQRSGTPLPRHTAVALGLGREVFVFEDTRYFGRFTLDTGALEGLGPEALGEEFTASYFAQALRRSAQPVKVKLLDQGLVAGIGNIYASEALFRAGISPRKQARRLNEEQIESLWRAIRNVLSEAIEWGSTIRLGLAEEGGRDRLFYYGGTLGKADFSTERLRVYERAGQPCSRCGAPIRRLVQGGRGTYFCAACQVG